MLKPEQVPDVVVWKLHNKLWGSGQFSIEEGYAAIAAAINAWPGMYAKAYTEWTEVRLPLPTEPSDE